MGNGGVLNGETAFRLYDTYGFPLDLTQDALRARGLSVDLDGFNAAMERQRAEARRAWAGSGEAATETVWYGLRERVGATEFLGYETETAEGVIRAILKDGVEVETLEGGESGSLILNQTPFYGEAGGQVGDVGEITAPGFRAKVTDTRKKLGDLIVHDVTVVGGAARPGLAVELAVDHDGAHGDARQSFGDPYFARSFAHGARRSCGAEGLARFARAAALRHRPSEADHAARNSKRSRTSPIAWCWRTPK